MVDWEKIYWQLRVISNLIPYGYLQPTRAIIFEKYKHLIFKKHIKIKK